MPYRNNTMCPNNRFVPGGALLPFLAGVAVTTPFVFLAKNQNQNQGQNNIYYPYQAPPYYYQQPMPIYAPYYPYQTVPIITK